MARRQTIRATLLSGMLEGLVCPTGIPFDMPGIKINLTVWRCLMKSEGRGWKKFVPSIPLAVRVFVAAVGIHLVTSFVYPKLPAQVQSYWPRI